MLWKVKGLLLLLAAGTYAAELPIDHVTVAGPDLKAMRAALEAVGIPTQYGGRHNNRATEMALAGFADGSYLELIAIQPDADPSAVAKEPWAKALRGAGGPCAWAVRVADTAAEVARLRAAGVPVGALSRSGRARPDGMKLEWEAAQVGLEPRGSFFPFLIHDFTPREQRAWPSGKPGNRDFTGVTRVVIAVHDLDDAVDRYRKAYGLPAPIKQVDKELGARLAALGGTPVVLASPLNAQTWLAQRIEQFGEAPCAFVLGHKRGKFRTNAQTRWFGKDLRWLDLPWRLGIE